MYESIGMKAVLAPILPWGGMQNSHWYTSQAALIPLGICDGQVPPDNPLDNERWVAAAVPYHMNREAANRVEHTVFTFEEMEEIKDIKNTINTYVDESQALFVMGEKNIDRDWDSYVREFDRMNLKRYLEISQSGYERAMGKKK
jgi:putative aldouronate transport system substrate-binding protein